MNDVIKLVYIGRISDLDLTIGKIYDLIIKRGEYLSDNFYYIDKDDSGSSNYYPKSSFKTLDEYRNEKILNILKDE